MTDRPRTAYIAPNPPVQGNAVGAWGKIYANHHFFVTDARNSLCSQRWRHEARFGLPTLTKQYCRACRIALHNNSNSATYLVVQRDRIVEIPRPAL